MSVGECIGKSQEKRKGKERSKVKKEEEGERRREEGEKEKEVWQGPRTEMKGKGKQWSANWR